MCVGGVVCVERVGWVGWVGGAPGPAGAYGSRRVSSGDEAVLALAKCDAVHPYMV